MREDTGYLTEFQLHSATASFSAGLNWQTPTSCKLCILEIWPLFLFVLLMQNV